MRWKKIREVVWFVFVFVLAIKLIEYPIEDWLAETAGDMFGALGLMYIAVSKALEDEDTLLDNLK